MIFSRKSSFDLSNKRTLFVSADRATVYQTRGGAIEHAYVFSADEFGRQQFGRYLEETAKSPLYVMVDVVEEEYRQDVIPHVRGSDRRSVLERKHARLFRGTKYCHSIIQGREGEGRKDDKVLLTAITNAEIVSSWVDVAAAAKAPVAGIYSLPILSQHMLKKIGATGNNVLLISMQSGSGLRQTFFRDKQLKISRLAQMPKIGSAPYAAHLMGELEKLRRYLNSLALISNDGPLEIYILSHGELLEELETHCRDTEDEKFFLVDTVDLNRRLGVADTFNSIYAEPAFSQLLLDVSPKNHYAVDEETKYYSLHRLRGALYAASALILLGGIAWSGFNFLQAVSLKQQALDAAEKADFYQVRYEAAREGLPPTPVEPQQIKTAVEVVERLSHYKSSPLEILTILSRSLTEHPETQIQRIRWISSLDPTASVDEQARGKIKKTPQTIEASPEYSHYDIAVVDAQLAEFDGNFRQAIELVDGLAAKLKAQPNIQSIEVLSYPVDTESGGNLAGIATTNDDKLEANFSLKIVLGIPDGRKET
ncbi:MAG: hypothetical protein ACU84Q_00060 [Gammaproteobacteria bacterium]